MVFHRATPAELLGHKNEIELYLARDGKSLRSLNSGEGII